MLSALPALVLVQTLVLLPVALLCTYGIGARIGGRTIGYLAALGWVILPHLADRLFIVGFHGTYYEGFLPQALGLSVTTAFPSTVCVLVAAYFAVTSIDSREAAHAVVAGLFAGFAVAIDPANALFLLAPAAGYAIARLWRPALIFGGAALPAVATVLLWKHRGLGHVPHVTADVDFHRLELIRLDLRTYFYSDRLIEVPFIAGVLAIARRSWAKSALVGVWFLAYVLVRGSSESASVPTASVFVLLMPVFAAFVVACAAIPLLVPRLADRLPLRSVSRLRVGDWRFAAALVVLALAPLVLVAALPVAKTPIVVFDTNRHVLAPVDEGLQTDPNASGRSVSLTWSATEASNANVYYNVYRSRVDGSGGLRCARASGAATCVLLMKHVGSTTERSYVEKPPPGHWTYRVTAAANWVDEPTGDDVLLVSPPATVSVR